MFRTLCTKHWDTLIAEQGPFRCAVCKKRVTLLKQWPLRDWSTVVDIVYPVCGYGTCEVVATQQRAQTVAQICQQEMVSHTDTRHSCSVCSSTTGTQRCGRCQLTPYCSVKCQKLDWPEHRAICKARVRAQRELAG